MVYRVRTGDSMSPLPPTFDGPAALLRIAEESHRLRALARAHGLAMLDYLVGMVQLEAEQEIRRRAARATDVAAPADPAADAAASVGEGSATDRPDAERI
jgi:hypothetical protein